MVLIHQIDLFNALGIHQKWVERQTWQVEHDFRFNHFPEDKEPAGNPHRFNLEDPAGNVDSHRLWCIVEYQLELLSGHHNAFGLVALKLVGVYRNWIFWQLLPLKFVFFIGRIEYLKFTHILDLGANTFDVNNI